MLRQLTTDDVEPLFGLFSDPEVMEFWSRLQFTSVEEARSLVERITERYHEEAGIEWGVAWKTGGPLIGKCGVPPLAQATLSGGTRLQRRASTLG